MSAVDSTSVGVEWRELSAYPGYRVNASGEVQFLKRPASGQWVTVRQIADRCGYLRLSVRVGKQWKRMYAHVLVLTAFVGPRPDGHECRHLDGNKTNNTLGNLAWGTKQENAEDSLRLGAIVRGSAHKLAVLNEEQVRQIKDMLRAGDRVADVARRFGVNPSKVSQIKSGYTWKHVA